MSDLVVIKVWQCSTFNMNKNIGQLKFLHILHFIIIDADPAVYLALKPPMLIPHFFLKTPWYPEDQEPHQSPIK